MRSETLELFVSEASQPQAYRVAASSASHGHAVSLCTLAPSAAPLADLPSLRERPTDDEELRGLGSLLFEALFTGDVRILYDRVLGWLSLWQRRRLRLILRMDPPELASLPWELLFDPERQIFLATDPRCSLSRSLTLIEPLRPLASVGPLRVLVVRPATSGLDLRAEDEVLRQVASSLGDAIQIIEMPEPYATPEALRTALRSDPHVVHFAGHAAFRDEEAVVVLDREDGMPWPCRRRLLPISSSIVLPCG